jgi:hypothetical protein
MPETNLLTGVLPDAVCQFGIASRWSRTAGRSATISVVERRVFPATAHFLKET